MFQTAADDEEYMFLERQLELFGMLCHVSVSDNDIL